MGMVFFGFLADRFWVNKILCYAVGSAVCGVMVLIMTWLPSYAVIGMTCGIFGFFIRYILCDYFSSVWTATVFFSVNYVLVSVILVELLSMSDFAAAFGLVCMVQGFGTLIGPPLAGKILLSFRRNLSMEGWGSHQWRTQGEGCPYDKHGNVPTPLTTLSSTLLTYCMIAHWTKFCRLIFAFFLRLWIRTYFVYSYGTPSCAFLQPLCARINFHSFIHSLL